MKRIAILMISLAVVIVLVIAAVPAMAAKRKIDDDGMLVGNGYPSGLHFNLNIHGKNESFECTTISGGGSIFIDEYGPATIEYTISKKSSLETLEVVEGCAIDGGTAKIQLPWKIRDDDGILHNADGYYAYARIRAKPQHGGTPGTPSSIVVHQNRVVSASDVLDPTGETGLLPLGLFTSNSLFLPLGQEFERWEDPNAKGKGKAKARNITPLFMWQGWIVELDEGTTSSLDIGISNGSCSTGTDGIIDDCDVPSDADTQISNLGKNPLDYDQGEFGDNSGSVDIIEEWLAFQADENPHLVTYVEDWIWNVAQLVVSEQDINNDGSKLFKIRFYPVSTTTFTEKAHIAVVKVTDPDTDLTTEFDFTMTRPDGTTLFSLENSESTLFGEFEELELGEYTVSENLTGTGWELTGISISDPVGTNTLSIPDPENGGSATFDLSAGETVIVYFTNTSASLEILKNDGVGDPLAGSEFLITPNPKTGSDNLTVVDNGMNDMDPYPGVLLVTGCMTGDTEYNVTEAVPPTGYTGDIPQTVEISSLTKFTLIFVNTEIIE